VSLPTGIENHIESKRSGHGVKWDFAIEKHKILSSLFAKKITGQTSNLIYANFNINTNPQWRNKIKNICLSLDYVTFKEPNLSYPEFISDVISHEAVVCPIGNAPTNGEGDNHRIYEVLYSNRVPIVFSNGHKTMYDRIYKFLPVVFLETEEQLLDKKYITDQINAVKDKSNEIIKFSHWKKNISDHIK
jgi:hypothetical protein